MKKLMGIALGGLWLINGVASQYSVAPSVGYYHFASKRNINSAALLNLDFAMVLTDQFNLAFNLGETLTENSDAPEADVTMNSYMVDGVYTFTKSNNIIPYVFMGLGVLNIDDPSTTDNSDLMNINAGLGVEYVLDSWVSLTANGRDVYTFSGGYYDWMLNAGIRFQF